MILLYPWHEGLEGIERRWQGAGDGCPLDFATVGVGHSDGVAGTLRAIVAANR